MIRELSIAGAYEITPTRHGRPDRLFLEICRFADLPEPMVPAQASLAVSARGGVRGIHYTAPPGQVKLVTCVAGSVFDVVVDLRSGSPTLGKWESIRLDDEMRRAVYIAPGLGHGYCADQAQSTLVYFVAPVYDAEREREIDPFDRDLAIDWPQVGLLEPDLSPRDRAAPPFRAIFPEVMA